MTCNNWSLITGNEFGRPVIAGNWGTKWGDNTSCWSSCQALGISSKQIPTKCRVSKRGHEREQAMHPSQPFSGYSLCVCVQLLQTVIQKHKQHKNLKGMAQNTTQQIWNPNPPSGALAFLQHAPWNNCGDLLRTTAYCPSLHRAPYPCLTWLWKRTNHSWKIRMLLKYV